MGNKDGTALNKDDKYFLTGGDLFILADRTLFCVHSYFFIRESPTFDGWLREAAPAGQAKKGMSEGTAIVLPDITADQFRIVLWCFYNPTYSLYDAPISAWETILYFADHYDFAQIKDLAVRELQTKDISLVDRIILYHKYRVPQNYLIPLYEELCTHEIPPSVPEAIKLGLVAVVIIFQARERLRTNSLNDGKSPVPKDRQKDVHTTVQKLLAQLPPDSFPEYPAQRRRRPTVKSMAPVETREGKDSDGLEVEDQKDASLAVPVLDKKTGLKLSISFYDAPPFPGAWNGH